MLVLTRKHRESVVISGGVTLQPGLKVTVLEIRGGKVKLGFEADRGVTIQRSELWEKTHPGETQAEPIDDVTVSSEK